jgi:hypothetical protein
MTCVAVIALYFDGFNDYESDKFQSLDLRVVLGGGLGYLAWNGENGKLGLVRWFRLEPRKVQSGLSRLHPFTRFSRGVLG